MEPGDETFAESAIQVLMDRGHVVVRPVGHLDRESIETLLGVLASARVAGVTAIVDLDAVLPRDLVATDVLERLANEGALTSARS